jgi:hemolysin type calcium-binding protein
MLSSSQKEGVVCVSHPSLEERSREDATSHPSVGGDDRDAGRGQRASLGGEQDRHQWPRHFEGNRRGRQPLGQGRQRCALRPRRQRNLLGGEGKDWVAGGDERIPFGGDKNLVGGPGNDGVQGGLGSDNALGGSGNDFVHGDNGSDRVMGEGGRDFVDGGRGSDRMVGGEGGDNSWSLIHSHSLKHAHGGGASRAVARDRAARGERRLRQRDYTLACASTPTSVSYLLAAVGTVATHDNHRSTTIPASPPCTPRLSAPTAGRHHFAGSGYSGVASLPCFFAFSQAA